MRLFTSGCLLKLLERNLQSIRDPRALSVISQELARLNHNVNDKIRRFESRERPFPAIESFDRSTGLDASILEPNAPWKRVTIEETHIPGMISNEECKYYYYIGKFYSGRGEVVELGPWLGKSTFHILEGLKDNPNFRNKKLHVFDDFVWRGSWMDDKVSSEERLENHQDFRFLFEKYTASFRNQMLVEKRKIALYDGNETVPLLEWEKGPVEIMYVDCGRTFEANQGWYDKFRRSFIRDRTLIIMQDWRLHREVPVKWYNQTKQFTDSKGDEIQLIHEVEDGGLATFLFRGK
jgi:hypothetical protein